MDEKSFLRRLNQIKRIVSSLEQELNDIPIAEKLQAAKASRKKKAAKLNESPKKKLNRTRSGDPISEKAVKEDIERYFPDGR